MGFLNRLFKKHEDELQEVIAVKPFRDYRANNKYRYQILVKGSDGTIYSGILLATATFPEIGQMINLKEWTSTDLFRPYKEDWQNMYGLKSISESHEMPKIAEICIDTAHNGMYMIHLGVGLFLTLPNLSDDAKASIYNFDLLEESDFEAAVVIPTVSTSTIVPLGETLVTPEALETCKKYVSFSGDALTAINLAIRFLHEQRPEAAKRIDEMAAFNRLYDRKPLEETNGNFESNDGTTCQEEQFKPATSVTESQFETSEYLLINLIGAPLPPKALDIVKKETGITFYDYEQIIKTPKRYINLTNLNLDKYLDLDVPMAYYVPDKDFLQGNSQWASIRQGKKDIIIDGDFRVTLAKDVFEKPSKQQKKVSVLDNLIDDAGCNEGRDVDSATEDIVQDDYLTIEPNYSFRNSGTQVTYCDSIEEIQSLTDDIEYCNGEEPEL